MPTPHAIIAILTLPLLVLSTPLPPQYAACYTYGSCYGNGVQKRDAAAQPEAAFPTYLTDYPGKHGERKLKARGPEAAMPEAEAEIIEEELEAHEPPSCLGC